MSQSSERIVAPDAADRGDHRRARAVLVLPLRAAASLVLAFAACGDVGDPNYASDPPEPVNAVDLASRPYCVGTCAPDYGSTRVDCSSDDGLEFFPFDVLDGETLANGIPTISGFYSYSDGTSEFILSGPSSYSPSQANFAPPAVLASGLCGPDNQIRDSNVHHVRGGLFREWGGGMGRRLVDFVTSGGGGPCPAGPAGTEDPDYCPDADPRIEDAVRGGADASIRTQFYGMMVDLRGWDGISFWARGGPNNSAGIRVYVGDRQLDEDVGYIEEGAGIAPMCRRVRECGCPSQKPCTQADGGRSEWFCWDPSEIPSIADLRQEYSAKSELQLFQQRYPLCGPAACDQIYAAFQVPDPTFTTASAPAPYTGTAQCDWYDLTNGIGDYFCYDKSDASTFPADGPERCGDGWAKGVALDRDWKFYKVPFTELRQEGYGKEFQALDLSKVTLVRFTWMQGWVDVWLDDVRFYREASSAPAAQ